MSPPRNPPSSWGPSLKKEWPGRKGDPSDQCTTEASGSDMGTDRSSAVQQNSRSRAHSREEEHNRTVQQLREALQKQEEMRVRLLEANHECEQLRTLLVISDRRQRELETERNSLRLLLAEAKAASGAPAASSQSRSHSCSEARADSKESRSASHLEATYEGSPERAKKSATAKEWGATAKGGSAKAGAARCAARCASVNVPCSVEGKRTQAPTGRSNSADPAFTARSGGEPRRGSIAVPHCSPEHKREAHSHLASSTNSLGSLPSWLEHGRSGEVSRTTSRGPPGSPEAKRELPSLQSPSWQSTESQERQRAMPPHAPPGGECPGDATPPPPEPPMPSSSKNYTSEVATDWPSLPELGDADLPCEREATHDTQDSEGTRYENSFLMLRGLPADRDPRLCVKPKFKRKSCTEIGLC